MLNLILDVLKWYLVLAGIGVISLPIAFVFLHKLSGKGFVYSRSLGLILISFLYWSGGMLGLLHNDYGGLLCAVGAVIGLSLFIWRKQKNCLVEWLRASRKYCIGSEILFLTAFLLIIIFRLAGPEVSGTEKPMELMFINSILKSESFPPYDAWLSGYSISYYYFGYIMSAVLVRLSGVAASVGFNLMLAAVFAMAAVSAFGILNDMLNLRKELSDKNPVFFFRALFAPLFILIVGNLEGIFEILHSLHLFWNSDGTSSFWTWVGLKELTDAPTRAASWNPTGRSGIWWWRASRVVSDMGLEGSVKEVIDEFPMFSFELGDLHPHVIAIPFVLFSIAIALNALIGCLQNRNARIFFTEGLVSADLSIKDTHMVKWICSGEFWLAAVCIGSLLFLNMWDFPFYFGLYCLCVTAAFIRNNGWNRGAVTVFFETAFPLGAASILLFSLFFMGFSSQAGGIALSGVFVTRPVHFLIMFGFFIIPILCWQIGCVRRCGKISRKFGWASSALIFVGLSILEFAFFAGLIFIRSSNGTGNLAMAAASFTSMQEISSPETGIIGFLSRRVNALPTLLILFLMAGMSFALLRQFNTASINSETENTNPLDAFCGLMVLIGAALVIFPEFFYLQDLFGTRMNTIFKFYYQAWILWGLAAAYSVSVIWETSSVMKKALFSGVMTILLVGVMIYPSFCIAGKIDSLKWKGNLTLDGSVFLQKSHPDEWNGFLWLNQAEPGVVLEKVGSSYGGDNIVSTFTGLPAVLGWVGHESQWRGGYAEIGSRNDDVKQIYETHSWETASDLLKRYNIRYVFIGSAEKNAYNIQEKKFERNLKRVFESGNCTIYQVY